MVLKIIIIVIVIIFVGCGILYNKNFHEKHFVEGYSSASNTTNDSLIFALLFFVIGFLLSILPWYLNKILLILIGLLLFCVSLIYI